MRTNRYNSTRTGFSLLELVVTTAILAMVSTSSMMLVRTAYSAWNRHHGDNHQRQGATALLRHLGRKVKQARAVHQISGPSDNSGSLTLLMSNGDLLVWDHDSATNEVRYGVGTADQLLAENIEQLSFLGLKTNMASTTSPGLIHSVTANATVAIDRPSGADSETFTSTFHIRSW